jgi:hypothetical protein
MGSYINWDDATTPKHLTSICLICTHRKQSNMKGMFKNVTNTITVW